LIKKLTNTLNSRNPNSLSRPRQLASGRRAWPARRCFFAAALHISFAELIVLTKAASAYLYPVREEIVKGVRPPVGAVQRAKRYLEKTVAQGKQKAAAVSLKPPTSYLVKQDIGGVPQDVRRLTVSVFEQAVESAIGRRLLGRGDRDNPWAVISSLFAGMFDDHTIEWLNKRGYLMRDKRCQGGAIIAADQCIDCTASLRYLFIERR
jgi:hypothetical protein